MTKMPCFLFTLFTTIEFFFGEHKLSLLVSYFSLVDCERKLNKECGAGGLRGFTVRVQEIEIVFKEKKKSEI